MPDDFALHAWVDESIHTGTGIYILAAAVADPTACPEIRDALRGLVRHPPGRIHWHAERDILRHRLIAYLTSLDMLHLVAVGAPLDPRRQERARRSCMEDLFHHLGEYEVTQVWMESRGQQDARDTKMVAALRSKGMLMPRVDFARPIDEPMLWVPDAVAGAVAAARKGQPAFRVALGTALNEIDVRL